VIVSIVLAIIKIAIMLGFFMTLAAVGAWVDRRQSAMVQDRVGPNRAMVAIPSGLARLLVLLPPSILGAFALAPAIPGMGAHASMLQLPAEIYTISVQLAVLVGWLSLVVLTGAVKKSGAINRFEAMFEDVDPRSVFYGGVAAHALGFALTTLTPPAMLVTGATASSVALAVAFFLAGLYSASRVPEGKVEIRAAGLLHVIADPVKLVWKEDFIPKNADKLLHTLAPMIALFPAFVTMAVIPFGQTLCFPGEPGKAFALSDLLHVAPVMGRDMVCRGHAVKLQIVDLNVGILYIFALASTGVIGAAIAGWSSDNKFSLLGGMRAASQMVSYEVSMGLSLVGLFMIYGSLRLGPMVDWQGGNTWGIFVQPFAFFLFLAASIAETKRTPFDQPEGESEIVAGYFLEYSSMKLAMFLMGEYIDFFLSSTILVVLFFGGHHLPFLHADGLSIAFGDTRLFDYRMSHLAVVVISVLAFFGKVVLVSFIQVFIRWTLPRFRYDQVMALGWKKLLPLSLVNILVTGVVVLAIQSAGPGVQSVLKIAMDCSQALVALAALAAFVWLVVGLLEPVERKKFLQSTAARFAAAAGGTKPAPHQA
jgi:NADH-quinone oxidoreductase subunit H